MSQSHIGICQICGKSVNLSYEHVPPQKAFNNVRRRMYSGEELRSQILFQDQSPWEYDHMRYIPQQQGAGYYSICKDCNNKTGSWYAQEYEKWVNTCYNMFMEQQTQVQLNEWLNFKCIDFRPLPVFKQIIAMFCSVNSHLHDDRQLVEFLLNRESTDFCKSKYTVYMYLFKGQIERRDGFTCILDLLTHELTVVSEISAYPLGFILCKQGDCSANGFDINYFCDYSYNEKCTIDISMPIHECNTVYPLDYRTKEEIILGRASNV